jgi:hypothetical protein
MNTKLTKSDKAALQEFDVSEKAKEDSNTMKGSEKLKQGAEIQKAVPGKLQVTSRVSDKPLLNKEEKVVANSKEKTVANSKEEKPKEEEKALPEVETKPRKKWSPEARAKAKATQLALYSGKDGERRRKQQSETLKAYYETEDGKETKAHLSEKMKEVFSDPEMKKRIADGQRKYHDRVKAALAKEEPLNPYDDEEASK